MFVERAERVHADAVNFVRSSIPRNVFSADAYASRDGKEGIRTLRQLCSADDAVGTQ